ncbi:B3 domain-containing protein Os04g0386900-like [Salvia miltiorrhiza]|uniref:B3 domain-containing protein Os04g0386900-like n=1 Tax=Salvia miltiorrhiza TaxID=226208 RepID=UPI0025AB8051|nr:B3 domain-containing protein Os04g0386900-like [Salvia miltiorrhiza]
MWNPSKQDARSIPEKKGVLKANEENPAAAQVEVDDGLPCLSGDKPFFDVILKELDICNLIVPKHMFRKLPRDVVPMVLTHGGKKWNMSYNGKVKQHKFESTGWRNFVADNNLECGDACIFELMESGPKGVRLRVVILRNTYYLPPQLQAKIPDGEANGMTPETAIEID